jgi:putative transposase
MPRTRRLLEPGCIQHVVNRGNAREKIFRDRDDYEEFIGLLVRAREHSPVPLLAFCLMPNHWHLVLWPDRPAALSAYMHWLTSTHVLRVHRRRGTKGMGHIYQERYRAVHVQSAGQFLVLCRYVEANALSAGLVKRAENWPYSSLSRTATREGLDLLSPWPIARPADWVEHVNGNRG